MLHDPIKKVAAFFLLRASVSVIQNHEITRVRQFMVFDYLQTFHVVLDSGFIVTRRDMPVSWEVPDLEIRIEFLGRLG